MNLRFPSSLKSLIYRVADAVAIIAAGVLAYTIYPGWDDDGIPSHYLTLILVAVLCKLGVSNHLQRTSGGMGVVQALSRIAKIWLATWGLLLAWLVFSKTSTDYSRGWLFAWAPLGFGFQVVFTFALRTILARKSADETGRTLLLGEPEFTQAVFRRMHYLTEEGRMAFTMGRVDDEALIKTWAHDPTLREVWVCIGHRSVPDIRRLMDGPLQQTCANIRVVPHLADIHVINHGISVIEGVPMIDVVHSPMYGINAMVKSLEDKLFAASFIILFSPVYLALALLVKLSSPGPVLYSQERVGWNGRTFKMLKFRSMTVDAESAGVQWGGSAEKKVTRIGHFMRRTSLDETPQFFNVLLGDMSIVGPRPERPVFVSQFREEIPLYMRKHLVKAGITGWAQINGWRGDTDLNQRIAHDLFYIENWSIWLDLKIILATPFKGLVHKNAK